MLVMQLGILKTGYSIDTTQNYNESLDMAQPIRLITEGVHHYDLNLEYGCVFLHSSFRRAGYSNLCSPSGTCNNLNIFIQETRLIFGKHQNNFRP